MNYTSRAKKLNKLSAHLYQRSLVVEASMVISLEDRMYKEAGIVDEAVKIISDPQIMEYISFGTKLVGLIATMFPATAAAGPLIIKYSGAIDMIACGGYIKNGQIIKAVFSFMSAILSLPQQMLSNFYGFMLSERFVSFLVKFKTLKLNYDTAAMKLFDFTTNVVPLIVDGFLNIIQGIIDSLKQLAPIIAKAAGKTAEEVTTQMTTALNGMTAEITSKLVAAI